jgi:hypothetical protein
VLALARRAPTLLAEKRTRQAQLTATSPRIEEQRVSGK